MIISNRRKSRILPKIAGFLTAAVLLGCLLCLPVFAESGDGGFSQVLTPILFVVAVIMVAAVIAVALKTFCFSAEKPRKQKQVQDQPNQTDTSEDVSDILESSEPEKDENSARKKWEDLRERVKNASSAQTDDDSPEQIPAQKSDAPEGGCDKEISGISREDAVLKKKLNSVYDRVSRAELILEEDAVEQSEDEKRRVLRAVNDSMNTMKNVTSEPVAVQPQIPVSDNDDDIIRIQVQVPVPEKEAKVADPALVEEVTSGFIRDYTHSLLFKEVTVPKSEGEDVLLISPDPSEEDRAEDPYLEKTVDRLKKSVHPIVPEKNVQDSEELQNRVTEALETVSEQENGEDATDRLLADAAGRLKDIKPENQKEKSCPVSRDEVQEVFDETIEDIKQEYSKPIVVVAQDTVPQNPIAAEPEREETATGKLSEATVRRLMAEVSAAKHPKEKPLPQPDPKQVRNMVETQVLPEVISSLPAEESEVLTIPGNPPLEEEPSVKIDPEASVLDRTEEYLKNSVRPIRPMPVAEEEQVTLRVEDALQEVMLPVEEDHSDIQNAGDDVGFPEKFSDETADRLRSDMESESPARVATEEEHMTVLAAVSESLSELMEPNLSADAADALPLGENVANETLNSLIESVSEEEHPPVEPEAVQEQEPEQTVAEPAEEPVQETIAETIAEAITETVAEEVPAEVEPESEEKPEEVTESVEEVKSDETVGTEEPAPDAITEAVAETVAEEIPAEVEPESEEKPEEVTEPEEPVQETTTEAVETVAAVAPMDVEEILTEPEDDAALDSESGLNFLNMLPKNKLDIRANPEEYRKLLEREKAGEVQIEYQYQKGFYCRLVQAPAKSQEYYAALKHELLNHEGVKSRISWALDTFKCDRKQIAKINVKGSTVYLYLALDPVEVAQTKYGITDVSGKKFDSTPVLLKIKGERKFKYALEMLDKLCNEKLRLSPAKKDPGDFSVSPMTMEEMEEKNYVKRIAGWSENDSVAQ